MNGHVNFAICVTFILYILATQNISGYYIFIKNLIKAIKEGKISRKIARLIIRKLRAQGILIDPELLEVVGY